MHNELQKLRRSIDQIDKKIVMLIAKRFLIVKKIGKVKKENGMKIRDKEREKEVIRNLEKQAEKFKLNKKFVNSIFNAIIKDARKKEYKDE